MDRFDGLIARLEKARDTLAHRAEKLDGLASQLTDRRQIKALNDLAAENQKLMKLLGETIEVLAKQKE